MACTKRPHKVTKPINHAWRDFPFDGFRDLLWDSSAEIQYSTLEKAHGARVDVLVHAHFNGGHMHTMFSTQSSCRCRCLTQALLSCR